MHPFFLQGSFCTVFAPLKKAKKSKSRISEEILVKISDYDFFIWVIFLPRREIFACICLYKSVSDKSVSDLSSAPKTRFFAWTLFCTLFDVLGTKKGPPLYQILNTKQLYNLLNSLNEFSGIVDTTPLAHRILG